MKYIKYLFAIVTLFLVSSDTFAQHSLQLDDGQGNISTIIAPTPGGTFILPPGNGTILTYLGLSSLAWLNNGNVGTNPASDPQTIDLSINNFIGTTDNKELDFVTNGQVRARFKESTGDTVTSGAFEPGLGV